MVKLEPKMENLLDILKRAEEGKLALPQFQRDFVWSRQDIKELLISLLNGHFIGAFLFLRTDPDNPPFAVRPIQGVRLPIDRNGNYTIEPEALILDGQQRISSLHYVFYAPSRELITPKYTKRRYLFFVDLSKLEKDQVEEAVFSISEDEVKRHLNRQFQFEREIVPLKEIPNKEKWRDWTDNFKKYHKEKFKKTLRQRTNDIDEIFNELDRIENELGNKIRRWGRYINNLFDFQVPALYLPKIQPNDKEKLTEVCTIFEKMNSTGVRLSVFDLLTARLYRYGIDLHQLWEETVDAFDNIRKLSEEDQDLLKVLLLRALGLMRVLRDKDKDRNEKEISDVKNKSLINLSSSKFEEDWIKISEYFDKAIERIMSTNPDGFGAFAPKWIPYKPMIPILAVLLYYIEESRELNTAEKARAYSLVKKWYWSSVFSERFSSAVESKSVSDVIELIEAFKDEDVPKVIIDAQRNISTLKLDNVATSSSAIYKGVMNLIALNDARDFLKQDAIEFHELEDHHIFPQAFLKEYLKTEGVKGEHKAKINTILNRTLISDETNKKIKSKSPAEYLQWIDGNKKEILEPHFIDEECIRAMEKNKYGTFLERRNYLIMNRIMELVGSRNQQS